MPSTFEYHDKLSVGLAVLRGLRYAIGGEGGGGGGVIDVILLGHDRGARVAHRLAVSKDEVLGEKGVEVRVRGVGLIDIVGFLSFTFFFPSSPSLPFPPLPSFPSSPTVD